MATSLDQPPIIFLMADQLRRDVLGAYGSPQSPTPQLTGLAEHATVFENHYTPCPLCVPARSSLMTGLPPQSHGAIINGWLPGERAHGRVKPGLSFLPERIADAGYKVTHVGIQHVHADPAFELQNASVEFIGPQSMGDHLRELHRRGVMIPDMGSLRDPVIEHDHGRPVVFPATSPRTAVFPLRDDLFYDVVLAEQMAKTIREHDGKKPLCLFGMFWLPHPPLWAPRAWLSSIAADQIEMPPTVNRWIAGTPAMQLANVPGQLGAHVSDEQWRLTWATYLAMTALLDHCIGLVLIALKEVGMLDEAAIVFTSDHGEMLGARKMYQKMCLYEDAAHVPLMMKLPHQKRGRRVGDLTDHLDLSATLLDLAGADPIEGAPGRTLARLADGEINNRPRQHVFSAYDGNAGRGFHHRMVRAPGHKFIHNIGDRCELYDLIEDPNETTNLAGRPEVADIEQGLRDALRTWMQSIGDPQPTC